MAFQKLTSKKATALTPQVVTLVVDDSGSMRGQKSAQATEAMQDLVITMQSGNQGSTGFRFLLNIAKFGTAATPLAEATRPDAVSLEQLSFSGTSGNTDMPPALAWAAQAVQKSLAECRNVPGFDEASSPNPLVVFFSDGANTGNDVGPAAQALKGIAFSGGNVDVVAVGIGMKEKDFPVMKRIASHPELAVNIAPEELGAFIADVGATVQKGETAAELTKDYSGDTW